MPIEQGRGVDEYYRSVAAGYREQYEPGYDEYPANLKRLELIVRRLQELGARTLLDCGCGEGTPMRRISETGVDVWGFDFEPAMVELARQNLGEIGLGSRVWQGDVTNEASLRGTETPLPVEGVDVCMATGVFPHVADEAAALRGIASVLRPGGHALIEFRNELFSLFTLNRYSYEFFRDQLVDFDGARRRRPEYAEALGEIEDELRRFFRLDLPEARTGDAEAPGYDEIPAKFRNPLRLEPLFAASGFRLDRIHYYHFHAVPPLFEHRYPELFRELSLDLEQDPSDWRGAFLCSAYVAEASLLGE